MNEPGPKGGGGIDAAATDHPNPPLAPSENSVKSSAAVPSGGGDGAAAAAAAPPPRRTFYKRVLPKSCIDFTSAEGKRLFKLGLAEGNMETFFPVSSQFRTQEEPAFCGLSSLVVALNALAVDPGRVWKGSWHWYSEDMLDCCVDTERVKVQGLTFDQVKCLAICNGLEVESTRAETSDIATFRETVRRVSANADSRGAVLLVSYDRRVLSQTGSGHFSPIAGYCEAEDAVLILDVARFKYNPHWVKLELLWEAQLPVDQVTGKSRGAMVLTRRPSVPAVTVAEIDRCCVPALLQQAQRRVDAAGGSVTVDNLGSLVNGVVVDILQSKCTGIRGLLIDDCGECRCQAPTNRASGASPSLLPANHPDSTLAGSTAVTAAGGTSPTTAIAGCGEGEGGMAEGGAAAGLQCPGGAEGERVSLNYASGEGLEAGLEAIPAILPAVRAAFAAENRVPQRGLEVQLAVTALAVLPYDEPALSACDGLCPEVVMKEVCLVRQQFEAVVAFDAKAAAATTTVKAS